MTVATDTTIVPNGMPRRPALPENFERHVSGAWGGMASSLAAGRAEEAVPRVAHVQA